MEIIEPKLNIYQIKAGDKEIAIAIWTPHNATKEELVKLQTETNEIKELTNKIKYVENKIKKWQ